MTVQSGQSSVYEPSQDERTLACISHLSIFVSSIGLLIAIGLWFYLRQRQPYAAFQAAQAVIFQFIVMILTFLVVGVVVFMIIGGVGIGIAVTDGAGSEAAFVAMVVLITLVSVAVVLILTLGLYGYAIYAAVRAYQGRPFRIPLISAIAESISPMPNLGTREEEP